VLSGTAADPPPTAHSFDIQVEDSTMATYTRTFCVRTNWTTLTITTETLPPADSNTAYSTTVQGAGGTPAYTFRVWNGTLPAGLSLATNGNLSGTTGNIESAYFTVLLDDGAVPSNFDTRDYRLEVFPQIPPPVCTLTTPASPASDDISVDLDASSPNGPTVDATFEFSIDAGATWSPCTPTGASPTPNPAPGLPNGVSTFEWDSRIDAVGQVAVAAGVLLRATVIDGIAPTQGTCSTTPFDVDNTALCQGICGDCNLDANGPDIIDALTAAQIAALLVTPTQAQEGCCDCNADTNVDILDALLMAQAAALLPVTLTCL